MEGSPGALWGIEKTVEKTEGDHGRGGGGETTELGEGQPLSPHTMGEVRVTYGWTLPFLFVWGVVVDFFSLREEMLVKRS